MAKEDDEEDNYSSSDEENFFDNPEEEEVEGEDEQDEETGDNQKSEKDLQLQRESRKEQKIKQVERRLQKPHADIILDAKRIWEKLRQKRLQKPDRKRLMNEMMVIVQGKALDIIYKHDASRIVQCCVKYGSPEQRDQVAHELTGHYAKLSQSKYGRFIVSKILQYCSQKYRSAVITDFYGKVRKLIRHKEASLVLDEAYSQFANAAQRNILMEEFYGPEFAIFKNTGGPRTLQELIKSQPLKKPYILKHTRTAIDSVLEKASFNVGKTPILHRAILDYLLVAEPAACKDLIELLKDHLVHMLHTREGARVAQYCILYAGPKDRKQIVKTFKGFVHSIAKEQYGHAVLLSCFECIDDTVLVGKALIGELFAPPSAEFRVNELLRDQYGSRVILYLLCGRSKRHQPAYVIKELAETDVIRSETSKKEPLARHEQLLEVTSPLLIEQVALYTEELLRDKAGTTILLETCQNAVGSVAAIIDAVLKSLEISAGGKLSIQDGEPINVVKKMKAEKDFQKKLEQGMDMNESILMGRSGTFAVKLLLVKPKEGEVPEWKGTFAVKTWALLKAHFVKLVKHCASNPSDTSGLAFIFVALFENGDASIQKGMRETMKSEKNSVLALMKEHALPESTPSATDKKRKRGGDEKKSTALEILFNLI